MSTLRTRAPSFANNAARGLPTTSELPLQLYALNGEAKLTG